MADLDVISIGTMMAEISPARAGVTIGETDELLLAPSGSATNFVLALTRLGVKVGFVSRVGDDDLGRWMIAALAGAGVDMGAVQAVPGQLSPLALATVDEAGEKTFAFYRFDGTCDPLASLASNDVDDGYLARGAVFDLSEGALRSRRLRTTSIEVAARARGLGAAVCVAPNYRPGSWARGEGEARTVLREALREADLAVMNAEEALLIAGAGELDEAIAWLADAGPEVVVVTAGGDPVHVFDRGAALDGAGAAGGGALRHRRRRRLPRRVPGGLETGDRRGVVRSLRGGRLGDQDRPPADDPEPAHPRRGNEAVADGGVNELSAISFQLSSYGPHPWALSL